MVALLLFAQRITDRRIVDGHADLLADDIFCMPDGPVVLDCLEFDDGLRYVDGIDDAAFLAMDLEFLGRKDLGEFFLERYCQLSGDPAPAALMDFYIAYRAIVRAKVDCVRFAQGRYEALADARRHLDIALDHLRAGHRPSRPYRRRSQNREDHTGARAGRTDSGTGDLH